MMRRRIRIIERPRRVRFTERLEAQARRLVRHAEDTTERSGLARTLDRQIALALDDLDATRAVRHAVRRCIRRDELSVGTEILQREPRPPVYEDPRLAERDMLRGRLLRLSRERRQLAIGEDAEMRGLWERLRSLVERRRLFGDWRI